MEHYVIEYLDPTTGEPRTANLEAVSGSDAWQRAAIEDKHLVTHAAAYTLGEWQARPATWPPDIPPIRR